jgi:hypothetical protein
VQTSRKLAVLGSGFAAVLILAVMTVFGSRELDKDVGIQTDYWSDLHKAYKTPVSGGGDFNNLALVADMPGLSGEKPAPAYRGAEHVSADRNVSLIGLWTDAKGKADAAVQVPWEFGWTKLAPSEQPERLAALRKLFEATAIQPVVDRVRTKMQSSLPLVGTDSEGAARTVAALEALLKIEAVGPDPKSPRSTPDLDPLFRYIFDDKQYTAYTADKPAVESVCQWLFPAGKDWTYQLVQVQTQGSVAPLDKGIKLLADYWTAQLNDDPAAKSQRLTVELLADLIQIRDADTKLAADLKTPGGDETGYRTQLKTIGESRRDADRLMKVIGKQPQLAASTGSLAGLYTADRTQTAQQVLANLGAVTAACQTVPAVDVRPLNSLKGTADSKMSANGVLPPDLDALDPVYFRPVAGIPRYDLIDTAYTANDDEIAALEKTAAAPTSKGLDRLADDAARIQAARAGGKQCLDGLKLPDGSDAQKAVCTGAMDQFGVGKVVAAMTRDASKIEWTTAAELTTAAADPASPATLPFLAAAADAGIDPAYRPAVAGKLVKAWAVLRAEIPKAAGASTDEFAARDASVKSYASDYVTYWNGKSPANGSVPNPVPDWRTIQSLIPADDAEAPVARRAVQVRDAVRELSGSAPALGLDEAKSADIARTLGKLETDAGAAPPDKAAVSALAVQLRTFAGKNPADARSLLFSAPPLDDLFGKISDGPCKTYWTGLTRTMLDSLAATGNFAGDKQGQIVRDFHRFPLAPPGPGKPMKPDELQAADHALADWISASAGKPLRESKLFTDEYARNQVGIAGDSQMKPADAEQIRRMKTLSEYLIQNRTVKCTISTITLDQARADLRQHPSVTLAQSEQQIQLIWNGPVTSLVKAWRLDGVSLSADCDIQTIFPLSVQFGSDGLKQTYESAWPCIEAVYNRDAVRKSDGKEFSVPVPVPGTVPLQHVVLSFSFPKAVPPLPN